MSESIPVYKDEENNRPVPTVWRDTLILIVEAIKSNNYEMLSTTTTVRSALKKDIDIINENIEDYGCQLVSLPESTWETSVCQWMIDYWDVLIDLYTKEEGASDMSLSIRVIEKGKEFEFEIMSLHVE